MEEININNINNKKALFIYYSGTNNTLDLVLKISKRLIKEEIISSYSLYFPLAKKKKNIDLKEYSYLFIAYPIYAFNSIKLLEKEIKRIIDFNKDNDLSLLKIIIIKQSGEALRLNNSSSFTLKKYLAKHHSINKNNIKEYHFLYPYNIHFRFKDEHIKELFFYNQKIEDILIKEIKLNLDLSKRLIKSNIFILLNSKLFKIQRIGGTINSFFYKVDNKKCINCKRCINECLTNNIYLTKDNKIKFHHHCLMCMRCSFFCPKDAINIGLFNSWKVNGEYDFKKIDQLSYKPYLNKKMSFFYRSYLPYFLKINQLYDEYFNE